MAAALLPDTLRDRLQDIDDNRRLAEIRDDLVRTRLPEILLGVLTGCDAETDDSMHVRAVDVRWRISYNDNLLWKKLIGGSGDETVTSVRETPDGGLLVCGTNIVNGLATIMLVKTDANGDIND